MLRHWLMHALPGGGLLELVRIGKLHAIVRHRLACVWIQTPSLPADKGITSDWCLHLCKVIYNSVLREQILR